MNKIWAPIGAFYTAWGIVDQCASRFEPDRKLKKELVKNSIIKTLVGTFILIGPSDCHQALPQNCYPKGYSYRFDLLSDTLSTAAVGFFLAPFPYWIDANEPEERDAARSNFISKVAYSQTAKCLYNATVATTKEQVAFDLGYSALVMALYGTYQGFAAVTHSRDTVRQRQLLISSATKIAFASACTFFAFSNGPLNLANRLVAYYSF